MRAIQNPTYDGAFMFCRIMFRNASNGDGAGWSVDWPRADENLSFRLSELTRTSVSRSADRRLQPRRDSAHRHRAAVALPVHHDDRAGRHLLRRGRGGRRCATYLQKGGFLWADDFWGDYAFEHWMNELRKALPSSDYPLMDVPLDHPLFHVLYDVKEIPQIPSISFWYGTGGGTSERGRDSATPHVRAISDRDGRILVVMTHNTDFGDAFEREGDSREYFERFAGAGYAFGINTLLYAMTH